MANNRLYIYCKKCNVGLQISKHYNEPYQISEESIAEINEFLENHFYDHDGAVYLCEEDADCADSCINVSITGKELPSEAEIYY